MASFIIKNDRLMLKRLNELILPTADEIYRTVIECEQVWPDIKPGRASVPEDLSFSRYPAEPKLVLKYENIEFPPILKISYISNAKILQFDKLDALEAGHLIENNTWYPINNESANSILDFLNKKNIYLGEISSIQTFLAIKRAALDNYIVEDLTIDEVISPLSFIPDWNGYPNGVNAKLYSYQIDGWKWLRFLVSEKVGGLLSDEMGLGKTLQIICVLADAGVEFSSPALIVAPGSLLENWCREFNRFAPKLSVYKHHGPLRTGRPVELLNHNIIVTSYETVVRDNSLMSMIEWDLIVIDEAQNIKNPDAIRTKALKKLKRKVGLAVTGTPLENRLTDIWSIVDFVLPGYLGNKNRFENTYENNFEGAHLLEPIVSPIILRRTISDVSIELPEKIDIPQVIKLEFDEANKYEKIREVTCNKYGNVGSLASLVSLRMYCCHPLLLEENANYRNDQDTDLTTFSKFQRLDEIFDEIFMLGDKIIVFTSFTKMSDLIIYHVVNKYKINASCIDGRVAINERQSIIDDFTNIDGSAILVLNPRAGGTGLNITAANHVVLYNPEWNPAIEDQATSRSHRMGQKLPVTVHRLITVDTVEEVIDERLSRKRELTEAAIMGVSGKDEDVADILTALQRSPITQR